MRRILGKKFAPCRRLWYSRSSFSIHECVAFGTSYPQGAAMAQLLEAVLRYIRPSPSPATMTRREAEQLRDRDLETALNLRTDALNAYYEFPGYCDEDKPFDGSP